LRNHHLLGTQFFTDTSRATCTLTLEMSEHVDHLRNRSSTVIKLDMSHFITDQSLAESVMQGGRIVLSSAIAVYSSTN